MYNKSLEYLLKNQPEKVLSKSGIIFRKLFSPFFRHVLVPLSTHNRLHIERAESLPKNRPIIFAPTHGFRDDIAFSIKTGGKHSYLLFASLPAFFNTLDGYALWTNGIILLDRKNKKSRFAAKEKMKYAITLGTNILMFPEGVWNKTENLPVQKLYPGIYDVAKETGALVVPIASIFVGNKVYAIREKAFDITEYSRDEGIDILREKMITAKYELIEKYAKCKRDSIGNSQVYHSNYIDSLVASTNGFYDYEIENTARYLDSDDRAYDEYLNHISKIKPCLNNAFVFSKRNHN